MFGQGLHCHVDLHNLQIRSQHSWLFNIVSPGRIDVMRVQHDVDYDPDRNVMGEGWL